MRTYHLPEHIHFCQIGGQHVFLDLIGDRYFSLPAAADAAFASLVSNSAGATSDQTDFLVRAGVLIDGLGERPLAATRHPRPTNSLVEAAASTEKLSIGAMIEAWLLVLRARHAVSKKRLPIHLADLSRSRPKCSALPATSRDRALGQFRAARRFVPISPNCLYDSMALCRFLQRRGIAANLIIGAKLHPFGAHCWLQDGATVLNDSLAAARDFQAVLVA